MITGTGGNDRQGFLGIDAGSDRYDMGAGDDFVYGGTGNDTMNGGADYDTLSYERAIWSEGQAAIKGISVNMNTGIVLDTCGGRDVISNFEQVEGSRFNDSSSATPPSGTALSAGADVTRSTEVRTASMRPRDRPI